MKSKQAISCTIMRGGTSKGLYFLRQDLPEDQKEWEPLLLNIMGSPDKNQIDGLGGAASVTSKVAVVSVSSREDADVDYTFVQVAVDKPLISFKGNCGNISSGVAPFALEKGLVKIEGPITKVRIYNTNTDKIIVSEVRTDHGCVQYDGDFSIAGVPGTAAPVKLSFYNPAGAVSGKLLPTGNVVDVLDVPEVGKIPVSIVDASNPLVFVKAEDLQMGEMYFSPSLGADAGWLEKIEYIRGAAACKMGLTKDYKRAQFETPGVPKMTIVSQPRSYTSVSGKEIKEEDIELCSRMMSMQKPHPSYAMTGAICTVVAANIPGTIVNQVVGKGKDLSEIRIGNPAGIIPAGVKMICKDNGEIEVESAYGFRTVNLLMEGTAYY